MGVVMGGASSCWLTGSFSTMVSFEVNVVLVCSGVNVLSVGDTIGLVSSHNDGMVSPDGDIISKSYLGDAESVPVSPGGVLKH